MNKIRVIPILLMRNGRCVKGINFSTSFRDTGYPPTAVKVYDAQDADELVVLDIDASPSGARPQFHLFEQVARNCFMPLTLGGGVRTIEDITKLLRLGADKVAITTAALEDPSFINRAAAIFGSQCIVVGMDVKKEKSGYKLYTHCGRKQTAIDPVSFAKQMEALGAGELLVTSIDHEGRRQGYDLELIRLVANAVNIPVIANGGAGKLHHFIDAVNQGQASAVAASSIFHFSDQSVIKVRAYMKEHGINVRIV